MVMFSIYCNVYKSQEEMPIYKRSWIKDQEQKNLQLNSPLFHALLNLVNINSGASKFLHRLYFD